MQRVKDIMTAEPACCSPETTLREVAQMMGENDGGCIPVVETHSARTPVGVITDRDICCRTVAEGRNPLELKARDVMTSPAVTVPANANLNDCLGVMEQNMIRRLL